MYRLIPALILFLLLMPYVQADYYNYQENAISVNWTGDWWLVVGQFHPENIVDGNWGGLFGSACCVYPVHAYIYMNYTKPLGSSISHQIASS